MDEEILLLYVRNAHGAVEDADAGGFATTRGGHDTAVCECQSLGCCIPLILPQSDGARNFVLDQHVAAAIAGPVGQVDESSRSSHIERERVIGVPERRVVGVCDCGEALDGE